MILLLSGCTQKGKVDCPEDKQFIAYKSLTERGSNYVTSCSSMSDIQIHNPTLTVLATIEDLITREKLRIAISPNTHEAREFSTEHEAKTWAETH